MHFHNFNKFLLRDNKVIRGSLTPSWLSSSRIPFTDKSFFLEDSLICPLVKSVMYKKTNQLVDLTSLSKRKNFTIISRLFRNHVNTAFQYSVISNYNLSAS